MNSEDPLQPVREAIDQIDTQLIELLSQRGRLALQVADLKRAAADGEVVYYRPEREALVQRRVAGMNQGPYAAQGMRALFNELISATLALEQPLRVAVVDRPGGVAMLAAQNHFGASASYHRTASYHQALSDVAAGNNDVTLLPVHDSVLRWFPESIDLLLESGLLPVGEIEVDARYLTFDSGTTGDKTTQLTIPAAAKLRKSINESSGPGDYQVLTDINAQGQCPPPAYVIFPERSNESRVNYDRPVLDGLSLSLQVNDDIQVSCQQKLLILARIETEPTGDDKTMWVVNGGESPLQGQQQLAVSADLAEISWLDEKKNRALVVVPGHHLEPSPKAIAQRLEAQFAEVKRVGSWPAALAV